MKKLSDNYFTLIEMLMIVSIIAILMTIMLPALKKAKRKTKVIACAANLRQRCVATMNYANDYNGVMPTANGYPGSIKQIDTLITQYMGNDSEAFCCPDYYTEKSSLIRAQKGGGHGWQGPYVEAVLPVGSYRVHYNVSGAAVSMQMKKTPGVTIGGVPMVLCHNKLSQVKSASKGILTSEMFPVDGGYWVDKPGHTFPECGYNARHGGNSQLPLQGNILFIDGHTMTSRQFGKYGSLFAMAKYVE